MKHAPHILLTGFGPFPGVAVNASARLAALLAKRARRRWPRAHVACATLPTEWVRGPERLAALWRRHEPDIALHFGVTARARGLEIERTGRNQCLDAEDACGQRPAASYNVDDGSESCTSTLPLDTIVAHLQAAGIPGCISDDAGSYLCNAILYRSLHQSRGSSRIGFIHIPSCLVGAGADGLSPLADCPLDWDQALDGAMIALKTTLEAR